MIQTGIIENAHGDLVTDVAYDFYGLRLATCSLDQRIKVWQLDETNGTWVVEDDWKAHAAAVAKLSWAHPEFGSIIASASYDHSVKIWEQVRATDEPAPSINGVVDGSPAGPSRWVERAILTDARGSVRSVEFAPHHFGLKLATVSSDNHIRVYECLEQPSLTTWQLCDDIDASSLPPSSAHTRGANTRAISTPTQSHDKHDSAPAPLVTQALNSANLQQSQKAPGPSNAEADGGWSVSWCKDRYWGEVLAAAAGTSNTVRIIELSPSRRPTTLLTLDPSPTSFTSSMDVDEGAQSSSPYSITSVSWAPSCGRSYHLIATGGRDGRVRIWRVKPGPEDDESEDNTAGWTASIVGDFDQHKSAIGRVEWNITGTVLSSAGNDGHVRLWKATSGNVWRPAGSIGVQEAEKVDSSEKDEEMDTC
ncbi:WD40 repeat-like protein [Schizophyllum commune H4-8]|uniref:WD40 repeat-like protein n=1 Tax=Schizophyllum commune (strain H4-8 / FGSC 9210) TaxID=578458 RepID=D8QLU8_SCHCM|nr:WD40 repeat-like protein [Schizophyllum commune H4-8]KAI5886661.1 WD40 repeat-like protein [Schizophyllum commune H4-8]